VNDKISFYRKEVGLRWINNSHLYPSILAGIFHKNDHRRQRWNNNNKHWEKAR
jgi:hypothetical protein